jgi:hypothetical protein
MIVKLADEHGTEMYVRTECIEYLYVAPPNATILAFTDGTTLSTMLPIAPLVAALVGERA